MKKRWIISLCAVMAISIVAGLFISTGQGAEADSPSQAPKVKFTDKESNSIVEVQSVLAQRQGKEVSIQDFGKWSLQKLGYSDLSVPCQDKYGALTVEYVLPENAAQGNDKWYTLNLDMEIDLGQDSLEGDCEIIVFANNVLCKEFYFSSTTDDGSLKFYDGDIEMSSTSANINLSGYLPGHFLYNNGVRPGKNFLNVLLVKYGGIEVESLRILNSSVIECTDTPEPGYTETVALRDYAPKLASDEEARARDIVMSDSSVKDLVADRNFSIDFISEWDMPQISDKAARVDICLDQVYEIEYDWPWPPEPIRKKPLDGNFWVREMTVIVNLDEGTVLGIMPQRHPIIVSPEYLPEEMLPEGYTPMPKVDIPELTEDEEILAKEMAMNDPVVKQMLAGKNYEVAPEGRIGVMHTSDDLRKIGAVIEIGFDKEYWFDYDQLSEMKSAQESPEYSTYMENLRSSGGLWSDRLMIIVNFEEEKVEVAPVQALQNGGEK